MTENIQSAKVHIGIDSLLDLPDLIRQYGKHPLLVHGHRPVEDGLLQKVRVLLNEAGIKHSDMGQILPNPKFSSVLRGVEIARKEGCDLILSLGGGSTLQCAKGIAYGMKFKGKEKDLWDLWKGKEKPKEALPVGAVLTNPGSGDELNNTCTLVKKGKQKTLTSDHGFCAFAVLDPTLSMLPEYPTMNQVFSIFSYVFIRALNSEGQNQAVCISLIEDLMKCAKELQMDISDLKARDSLFWAGYQAHRLHINGDNTLIKPASALAFHHSLTRGESTSALFFAWLKEQAENHPAQVAQVGRALFDLDEKDDHAACDLTTEKIRKFTYDIGMAANIPETGLIISDEDLKKLADDKQEYELLKRANRTFKEEEKEQKKQEEQEEKNVPPEKESEKAPEAAPAK